MKFKIQNNKNLYILEDFEKNWKFCFWQTNIRDNKLLSEINDFLLQQEEYIITKYESRTDGGTGLGPETTTARYSMFNLLTEFNNPAIEKFKNFISREYKNYLNELDINVSNIKATCWYNVLHYGQHIQKHFHGDLSRASANFIVNSFNSSTFYEMPYGSGIYEIHNEPGTLTIFNSMLPHYTSKNLVYKERISIALDFYDTDYQNKELAHVMESL